MFVPHSFSLVVSWFRSVRMSAFAVALALSSTVSAATVQYAINAGGSAASPFAADAYFTGGGTYSSGSTISTSGVTDPAPQAVYQAERYGNSTYTFPGLTAGTNYLVRLHFAETYFSSTGQRQFNVLLNGTQVLTNFDIVAAAGGQNIATVREFTVAANSSSQIMVQFQNGAADNAKVSGIEIIDPTASSAPTIRLNVDINSGSTYTGTAASPDTGTVWNGIGAQSTSSVTLSNVLDSKGKSTAYSVTLASSGSGISTFNNTTLGNPTPVALMGDYAFGNTYTVTLAGLPVGNYFLYVYAHGDQANQNSTVTVAAANGGATGTTATTGTDYRNLTVTGAQGYSYLKLQASVGATGTLVFTTTYLNGFQLSEYPRPVIAIQPPAAPSAVVGGNFNMAVSATGEGTLTYQWRKGGVNLANGASGTGSTYSGATSSTLAIGNAQSADAGSYDVVVTNPGGDTVSSASVLTLSSTPQAPVVVTGVSSVTVLSTQTAAFSVAVNGTSPLTYVWRKDGVVLSDGLTANGSAVSGGTTANLSLANATLADAGSYSVTVTNSVGNVTSTGTLTINQAPTIATQPASVIVASGLTGTLSATFGAASPAPSYSWEKSSDGITYSPVSGATGSSLGLTASLSTSGFYRIVATNSVGTVTSSVAYFGVSSTQSMTFAPVAGATGINPDAPLVISFPSAPRVGVVGKITVRKASDDSVVETIDLGALQSLTSGSFTYRYQSKNVGGGSGGTYNYFPVVIVGNEARVTLKSGTVLQYGTAYYVNLEAGAIIDSAGASIPVIANKTTWAFTTRASAPASVPTKTTFTVAADGSGDFSTLQGALDFIPGGNTTPVRLNLRNGTYEEIINYGSRHNITLVGQSRDLTVVEYPNNNTLNPGTSARISYYAKGNDLAIANLTINNSTPYGGGQAEALRSDGARNVFIGSTINSHQDTLLLGAGNYFQDCLIQGDTDFVWGGGTALFKNCELRCLNGGDLTQARTPLNKFGFVFVDCSVTRPAGSSFSYTLGRNSANATTYGNAAFISCRMDTHISTAGWSSTFIDSAYTANVRNWEYHSTNIAGTASINVSQRTSSRQLTDAEALILRNPANVFGTTTDGTPGGAQGDGWVPSFGALIFTQPAAQTVALGQSASFSVLADGTATLAYQWYRNGVAISGATASTYTIPSSAVADWGTYTVVVSTGTSLITSDPAAFRVTAPVALWAEANGLDPAGNGAPTADPDGDDIPNMLEYLFDGDPTVADRSVLPVNSVISDAGGQSLVLEYNRSLSAAAQLLVAVETSTDLGSWGAVTAGNGGVTEEKTALNAQHEHMKVTIPFTGARLFARVRATY